MMATNDREGTENDVPEETPYWLAASMLVIAMSAYARTGSTSRLGNLAIENGKKLLAEGKYVAAAHFAKRSVEYSSGRDSEEAKEALKLKCQLWELLRKVE